MKNFILSTLLVILIIASVNADAQVNAARNTEVSTTAQVNAAKPTATVAAKKQKPCCEPGCLTCNKCLQPKIRQKIKRLCKIKKFSRCFNRKRCCVKVTKCVGGFCKTSRRKCSWVGAKIKKFCKVHKKVTRITCELFADPHVKGFNKQNYEAQTVGDWVLYKGRNLEAHYRGQSMGSWVGAVKFGVRLFKDIIYSVNFQFNQITINGKIVNIKEGVNRIRNRGSITKAGNKITFSTNDGESVQFVTFGSFFNAYVNSNVEKISGVCSKQFIQSKFFSHPRKGKIVKFKHVKCPKRKHYTRVCQRRNLKGVALKECVSDLCRGLPKKIEDRIINKNKKPRKQKKRVTRIQCSMFADPHVHGFNNRNYEAQTVGDWLLYRGDNLAAHYRGQSMGSWVGAVKFGVRLYDTRIYSNDLKFTSLIINGKVVNIKDGVRKLSKKGEVRKTGNKLTFSTNDGEEVDFITFGTFMNVYVRSNVETVGGICSQQFIKSRFFNHVHIGKLVGVKKPKCPRRKIFKKRCMGRKLKGTPLRQCVFDYCSGINKKIEQKIININKEEKKEVKIQIKRVSRVTCELYADPHVKGFNQRYYEAQTVGDWILYRGAYLSAHYRGKSMGSWVGAIKFGVRLYGDRITSTDLTFNSIRVNGEIRTIGNGITKISEKGIVIKQGNKLTFDTNDGEAVDFVSFGTFMNAYVRSNVAKVSGICSQQFLRSRFFNTYHVAKIIRIKDRPCPQRKLFTKTCRKRGLTRGGLRQCISDLCNGLNKDIERKIIKWNKMENHKRIKVIKPRKIVTRIQCSLYADPHVHGFNNRYYEAQLVGDWILYKGANLQANYRGQSMGSWVGAVKFGVILYDDRITSHDLSFNSIIVNGQLQNLRQGRQFISKRGTVTKAGNKLTFSTNDGEEVDFITYGTFFNAYVRSNYETVHGICSQEFTRSNFFNHHVVGKRVQVRNNNCALKARFTRRCKRRGLLHGVRRCIIDLCNGMTMKFEKRILRRNRREAKKRIKRRIFRIKRRKGLRRRKLRRAFKIKIGRRRRIRAIRRIRRIRRRNNRISRRNRRVNRINRRIIGAIRAHKRRRVNIFKRIGRVFRRRNPFRPTRFRPAPRRIVRAFFRPPRPVFRPRPVVFRPVFRPRPFFPVFRRGGRGDVWLQNKGGKWIDVDVIGTFLYAQDDKIGLKIKVQFTPLKDGSITSAVSVEAKDQKIVAESDGKVTVNGTPVKYASAIFDFSKKGFNIFEKKGKKGEYEIRGLGDERLSFNYRDISQSYMLEIGSTEPTLAGLLADPENPAKYQVKKEESLFATYVEYKKLPPIPKPTPEVEKAAEECCGKVKDSEAKRECKIDFYRTQTCFSQYASKNTPKLQN